MPFSLIWLPEVLKRAGLKVATEPGWETRGHGDMGKIHGVICHHTAGSRNGNMPTLRVLVRGRAAEPGLKALPGPLSQLGLGRDGTWYVIAAGRCNHAGKGVWKGLTNGNTNFIGVEAENTGRSNDFPWPAVQMEAYARGVAAILAHVGRGAEFCAGHREYARPAGRKSDPSFDMVAFRAAVAGFMDGSAQPRPPIPPAEPDGKKRPTLRRGDDASPHVAHLQANLGIAPPGPFGPKTEAAVRQLQRDHGLVPDGIVGPRTWALVDALP